MANGSKSPLPEAVGQPTKRPCPGPWHGEGGARAPWAPGDHLSAQRRKSKRGVSLTSKPGKKPETKKRRSRDNGSLLGRKQTDESGQRRGAKGERRSGGRENGSFGNRGQIFSPRGKREGAKTELGGNGGPGGGAEENRAEGESGEGGGNRGKGRRKKGEKRPGGWGSC